MDDTGLNVPESAATLLLQQKRLVLGLRPAQMFPKGTIELSLPEGMWRFENKRGVFHYNPKLISDKMVSEISEMGKENLILELGPFDKKEIERRIMLGEFLVGITEFSKDGVEIRSAIGTTRTAPLQAMFFEQTMAKDSKIVVGPLPPRVVEKYHAGLSRRAEPHLPAK